MMTREQFIDQIMKRLDSIMDNENLDWLISEAFDYVCEENNIHDEMFTDQDEHYVLRQANKRSGVDMRWYDLINPSPEQITRSQEQRQLGHKEKERIQRDIAVSFYNEK